MATDNKELLFAKTLESVRKTAIAQGNVIDSETVRAEFREMDFNEEQLELVFDYLKKHGIGIDEEAAEENELESEDRNYLDEYLDILAALPEYSDGEKQACMLSAMAGEKDAQKRLIEIYLSKVAEIARLYSGQGVYLEDLIGQGNMALSEGVSMLGSQENAKEGEGMLIRMIMDSMEELIQENLEEVGQDKKLADIINEIADKARDLAQEMRRKVTVEELAEETGMDTDVIRDAYRMSGYAIEDLDGGATA